MYSVYNKAGFFIQTVTLEIDAIDLARLFDGYYEEVMEVNKYVRIKSF